MCEGDIPCAVELSPESKDKRLLYTCVCSACENV